MSQTETSTPRFHTAPAPLGEAPTDGAAAALAVHLRDAYPQARFVVRGRGVFTDGAYYGLQLYLMRATALGFLEGLKWRTEKAA